MPQIVSTEAVANQQAYIFAQFNGTTYQPNAMDVQHEPIYDTYTQTAGTGNTIPNLTQFFTNPQNKTINQTNVQRPKQLDAPEAFAVMSIRAHILENILLADLINLFNSMVLEFWIGNKWYNRGPLWHYNAGGGIAGAVSTTANATTITAWNNGTQGRNNMGTLEINIVIDNQASFYGQLNGVAVVLTAAASGGTGATIMMLLDGLHARGVQ
jgi:hypothetical protein